MMCSKYCLFILILIIECSLVISRTIFLEDKAPTKDEISFMGRYGYLPYDRASGDIAYSYTASSVAEAVKKLQAFAGIPTTGVLDAETRKVFSKRRCGVKDIVGSRNKRYIVQQGWSKRQITYRVVNGSSTLAKNRVESLMAAGLAVWAPHGGLQFRRKDEGPADIQVSFASGDHGDGFPFDGTGRVVAHAFPPPHGAMHFDDDELWGDVTSAEDEDITDFFAVAVHEIGHALGLSHSDVKSSVMYPYYQVPIERLHMDDILGMQELYLKNQPQDDNVIEVTDNSIASHSSLVPRFTKADSDEEDTEDDDEELIPDLCFTNYDTIQVMQGKIFVFEEEWMWVLEDRKVIEPGYPKRFHDVFIGLPKHVTEIRTVYEKLNGNIVIFSGRNYWEFDRSNHLFRRGKLRDYTIPSQVAELSTVFLSNYNNKTYLIESERFWRYDEAVAKMDLKYPKDMSAWRKLPYPVDAAAVWKGDTYFFRGPRFWRFDNKRIMAHEYYPLPTAQIWFPCEPTPDMDTYLVNDLP